MYEEVDDIVQSNAYAVRCVCFTTANFVLIAKTSGVGFYSLL